MAPERLGITDTRWETSFLGILCNVYIQQSMDPTAATMIERTDLLDKVNFLALPGTIEKPVKKNDQIKEEWDTSIV